MLTQAVCNVLVLVGAVLVGGLMLTFKRLSKSEAAVLGLLASLLFLSAYFFAVTA